MTTINSTNLTSNHRRPQPTSLSLSLYIYIYITPDLLPPLSHHSRLKKIRVVEDPVAGYVARGKEEREKEKEKENEAKGDHVFGPGMLKFIHIFGPGRPNLCDMFGYLCPKISQKFSSPCPNKTQNPHWSFRTLLQIMGPLYFDIGKKAL
uniref:Uncharacterized protein n=1 Tax=Davidia involucrata TaxID=16924 RepID=A0A5B6YVQ6_DAVIN